MTFWDRLKSPWVIVGFAGILYRVLTEQFGVNIDEETFRFVVDALSYVFIGIGVYSTHGAAKKAESDERYDV